MYLVLQKWEFLIKKKTFKILQSEIHVFCIPEEESFKCFYFVFVLFFQLVHSLLPPFLEFSWQEKQLSEVFLNYLRAQYPPYIGLHIWRWQMRPLLKGSLKAVKRAILFGLPLDLSGCLLVFQKLKHPTFLHWPDKCWRHIYHPWLHTCLSGFTDSVCEIRNLYIESIS